MHSDEAAVPARAEPPPGPEPLTTNPAWLVSSRSFWIAAVLLTTAMFSLMPVMYNGYIAIPDEGVYSAQARALVDGGWVADRPEPDLVQNRVMDPLAPSAITEDGRIPYGRHPLFSIVLSASYTTAGKVGLVLVSVLCGSIASILIGLICRSLDPRFGIPSMALAGLSSPLLFNSYVVSAHSMGVAFASVVVLSTVKLVSSSKLAWLVPMATTAMLLPMVRTESIVLIASLAMATGLMALPVAHHMTRSRTMNFYVAVTITVFGAIGWLLDRQWAGSILGSTAGFLNNPNEALLGEQTDLLNGAWVALLQPWQFTADATPWIALDLLLILTAVLIWRVIPGFNGVAVILLALAAIGSVVAGLINTQLITGLIAAWPLAIFALVWPSRDDVRDSRILTFITTIFLALIGLVLSIYGDGGATQWGGRLFQILLPLVIPLAVLGMSNALGRTNHRQMRVATAALVVIALAYGGMGLQKIPARQDANKFLVTEVASMIQQIRGRLRVSSPDPDQLLVIISPTTPSGTTRAFWEVDLDLNIIRVPFMVLAPFLAALDADEYPNTLLLSEAPGPTLAPITAQLESEVGLTIEPAGLDSNLYLEPFIVRRSTARAD